MRRSCPSSRHGRAAEPGRSSAHLRAVGILVGLVVCMAGCARSGGQRPAATPAALSIPRFTDAAGQLGIRFAYDNGGSGRYYYAEVIGGGGALFDYDGDGWLDVYLVQGAPLPGHKAPADLKNRLYRNRG